MFKKPSKQDKAEVYNSIHSAANRIYDVIVSVLCVKEEGKKIQKQHLQPRVSYKLNIHHEKRKIKIKVIRKL